MKKLIYSFFLVLFLSAFVVSISVFSQPPLPPCDHSCAPPFTQWVLAVETNHTLPGGSCPNCSVSFEYWYRICNGNIEVVVGSVFKSGDCALCDSWITWYAHDWASKHNPAILDVFAANWHLGERYCYDEQKFSMLSCYHWVPGGGITNPGGWHSEPCATEECCTFNMTICKNENGDIESAYQQTWPPMPVICEDGCENNCVFFSDSYKIGSLTENSNEDNNRVIITPNPNNGNFIVNFNVAEKGVYTVIITDLLGNTIYSESISVNSLSMQKEITLEKCNAGTYLYSIMFDTQSYQSGKISVIK